MFTGNKGGCERRERFQANKTQRNDTGEVRESSRLIRKVLLEVVNFDLGVKNHGDTGCVLVCGAGGYRLGSQKTTYAAET